ncbi:hypothetical protein [Hoeflea sp.]|uniref:hypothetical protein n=1 Tax=Hoeflea sp. TaxID=1940281 RepID=UPI0019C9474B|nr:hypothetical protein [Hoeflea sp.]MBC7280024.1 hypothetical protein [Hoeflea sp.]
MIDGTVTKSEFAARIGVSAGRISQMIKAGQIAPGSLAGEGRTARIIVNSACADLRRTLDPAQSHGLNGMATRSALTGPTPAQSKAEPAPPVARQLPPASAPPPGSDTADLIGREKLRQAEFTTRRMEREEALEEGRFVLADDARAAISSAASKMLSTFESGLSDMADAIAADHSLPPRDVLHTLTKAFRQIREDAARAFAGQRDAIIAAEAEALARAAEAGDEEDDETE